MLETFRHRLRHNPHIRGLIIPGVAICVASLVIALFVWVLSQRTGSPEEQARRLASVGELSQAEALYWQILQTGPVETETLIEFIDVHAEITQYEKLTESLGGLTRPGRGSPPALRPVVSDREILEFLSRGDIDQPVALLGQYWFFVQLTDLEPETSTIEAMADARPPVRFANHLLARAAWQQSDSEEAATRFESEGLAFPDEATTDLRRALHIWISTEDWDEVRLRVHDPDWSPAIGPLVRLQLAEADGNWGGILFWLWPSSFENTRAWPLGLALLAGALWFAIAASLGRITEGAKGRWQLYVAAFFLGVLSIYPTLVIITLEQMFLNLRQTGQPVADAIYYVFGVGLREELCKLLLFLPLLPVLNKRGSRLEALICAAIVGLGFAAEENIGYFSRMDASVALARFLTANFLHMALTGLIGLAAYDSIRLKTRYSLDFNVIFPVAILMHGAYDFLLVSPAVGEYSIFAMTIFILLSQWFLRQIPASDARHREGVLRLFVLSLLVLTGASYIYATTLVGPGTALGLIASGLLGVAILIIMFTRELSGG